MLHTRDFIDQNGYLHHAGTVVPLTHDATRVAENTGPEVRRDSGAALGAAIVVMAGALLTLAIFAQSPMIPLEATMFLSP